MSGNAPPRAAIVFISVIFVAYALFVFWRATFDFQPVAILLAFVAFVGGIGIAFDHKWASYCIYVTTFIAASTWLYFTVAAAIASWPYDRVLFSIVSLIPGMLLIALVATSSLYVYKYFNARSDDT